MPLAFLSTWATRMYFFDKNYQQQQQRWKTANRKQQLYCFVLADWHEVSAWATSIDEKRTNGVLWYCTPWLQSRPYVSTNALRWRKWLLAQICEKDCFGWMTWLLLQRNCSWWSLVELHCTRTCFLCLRMMYNALCFACKMRMVHKLYTCAPAKLTVTLDLRTFIVTNKMLTTEVG